MLAQAKGQVPQLLGELRARDDVTELVQTRQALLQLRGETPSR